MATTILISTVLMGALLLVLVVGLRSAGHWQSPVPSAIGGGELIDRTTHTPVSWMLGFLLLIIIFAGGAVAAISDGELVPITGDTTGLFGVGLGVLLALYLGVGTYAAMLARGRSRSQSVVITAFVLGMLFVLGVAARLILA